MKSFLHGRPVQKSPQLRSLNAPSNEPIGKAKIAGHDCEGGPSVECVKQGEKVVRLIVTCSCGEKIEIECLYPAGG
jgi:hypothetical protein